MVESNPSVTWQSAAGVGTVTLNRPARYNAVTVPMMQRLFDALAALDRDAEVHCVVLGSTGKGFCAGQDLKVLGEMHAHGDPTQIGDLLRQHYNAVAGLLRGMDTPVIGAVQGMAAGAGWSLAMACDLRIAARSAKFVPAFARLGLVPDLGGSRTLVEQVGYARAMEFALCTEMLTAEQAHAWGLVNRVVEDDALDAAAAAWARQIADLPGEAARLTKRTLRAALAASLDEQLTYEAHQQSQGAAKMAHRAAVAGFLARK